MAQDTIHVNLKGLFLALVAVIGVIVFSMGALANNDPWWFLPVFNPVPEEIIVYKNGCTIRLVKGQPGFENLTTTVNQAVVQYEAYNSSFGFSFESLKEYRDKEQAVEIFYSKPVTIHTPYKIGNPTSLFIPLSSYFAESKSLFGGHSGTYWAGALRLKSIQEIQRAVDAMSCSH